MKLARLISFILFALGAPAASAQPATPAPTAPRLALDSRAVALGGALKTPAAWQAYKARFVTEEGRVVDTANNLISHSEGQGYAMLLAVAANDRGAFDRLWTWTRANLMVRDDQLLAWRWEPRQRPAVSDMNNATDGDLLVAWALTEAAEFWGDLSYRVAARRIAVEVARKAVLFKSRLGAVLLPAVAGFNAEGRPDGPVVNLSYYVFPAFARLPIVAPEVDWAGLTQTGLDLLELARPTPLALPADWISLQGEKARPADGFAPQFAYNAVRVPLYLAWAGIGEREHYAPFVALAERTRGALAIVDVSTGKDVARFGESGFEAIAALTNCTVLGSRLPIEFAAGGADENYYPATLRMLALVAVQMRYPSCLRK